MKRYILLLLSMAVLSAGAQTDRHFIRQGNREVRAKNYAQAEVNYKKSLGKNSSNAIAAYNLGRALQAGRKDSLALKQYETAANLEKSPTRRAESFYNMGTVLQGQKKFDTAIEAYKNALRNNPNHQQARYNLALCIQQKKQQQQQNKSSSKNKQNNKDKQDKKKQNDKKNDKKKPNEQNQKDQMSKDNAEQLLNAALQEEKATQERLKKAMRQKSSRKLEKNW